MRERLLRGLLAAALLAIVAGVGCVGTEPAQTRTEGLTRPVPLPDLSLATESVQTQIRGAYEALTRVVENADSTPVARADAYGALGNLLLAAEFFDEAEVCYLNAHDLTPEDVRWPYYLGHLHRTQGAYSSSAAFFRTALALQPEDVPTLVWLGEAYLGLERADDAEASFARAASLQPDLVAAVFGLGRSALARGEYQQAVDYLEEALRLDPQARGLHYPLGMAYRGLGDLDRAEAHLKQREETQVLMPDPLMQELNGLLESVSAYESSGIRALEQGEWEVAADYFREGLALAPTETALHHRLGTALYLMGDTVGARTQFEETLRQSPEFAQAHYSLGVLLVAEGAYHRALERLSDAVRYEPEYVEARLLLADLLRHTDRPADSLPHYEQIVTVDPQLAAARLGQAMALVELEQWVAARDTLSEATRFLPDQRELAHALARVLAAAPDDQVRDGQRAVALMETLLAKDQTVEWVEALAMALAEVGRYTEAVGLQRDVTAAAQEQGWPRELVIGMTENLRRYENGLPCRVPWTAGITP